MKKRNNILNEVYCNKKNAILNSFVLLTSKYRFLHTVLNMQRKFVLFFKSQPVESQMYSLVEDEDIGT